MTTLIKPTKASCKTLLHDCYNAFRCVSNYLRLVIIFFYKDFFSVPILTHHHHTQIIIIIGLISVVIA